jgi:hypothetical protein
MVSWNVARCSVRFLLVVCAVAGAAGASEPDADLWDPSFFVNGPGQGVSAVAVDSRGDILVGGYFDTVDDLLVNNIARWDGTRWHAMRDGLPGSVNAVVVDDVGNVFVGGSFEDAGGHRDADNIAMWNGTSWSAIGGTGSGLPGPVFALGFDAAGDLVAGGSFLNAGGDPDADRIARWNGSSWTSIGGPGSGVGATVYAIAFAPGDVLIIGGSFSDAGGNASADNIAGWNGSSWSSLGTGLNGNVHSIEIASNGDLYAGGSFTDAGGDADADRIAMWSSPSWSSVGGAGSGVDSTVYDIAFNELGQLTVAGNFSDAGGDADADGIAVWHHGTWNSIGGVGSSLSSGVKSLARDGRGDLFAGGVFENVGRSQADYLAQWSGTEWNPVTNATLPRGGGLNSTVHALALDSDGRLYAGGEFGRAGGDPAAEYFAVWDGTEWSALGGPSAAFDGYVFAAVFDLAGDLIVGGEFQQAGGDPDANMIARWNGASWESVGGSSYAFNSSVRVLVLGPDGLIYAGGEFEDVGGDPDADYLVRWDGLAWTGLGGASTALDGEVFEIVFDAQGNLYAGGDFSDAGGNADADYLARWNGATWEPLVGPAGRMDGVVYAMAFDDQGRLYVGGDFDSLGGDGDSRYIAMWDGSDWSALQTGLNDYVFDLAVDGSGNVFAAGDFDADPSDPTHPDGIAMWDGTEWHAVGGGINDTAFAVVWDGETSLYVGGDFSVAGETPSLKVARYLGASSGASLFSDGFESGDLTNWSGHQQ